MPPKFCLPQSIDKMANQANAVVDRTADGRYVIRSAASRQAVKTVNTEEQVREYLKNIVNHNAPNLDGSLPFPARTEAASATPLGPQAQLTPFRRVLKGIQLGPAAFLTPIKQISQNIEALRNFPAFTKIYEPLQRARQTVDSLYAYAKREAFGGKTYQESLRSLALRAADLDKEQQHLMTLLPEYLTKEEVAQGGKFLGRAMTPEEINLAGLIPESYVEDIPTIIRRNALIDNFLRNRDDTLNRIIPQMEQAIAEGRLPPLLAEDIARLRNAAGEELDLTGVYNSLGFTDDERFVSGLVRMMVDDDTINVPAVYRYATAPELKEGFASGWDQMVAERGVQPLTAQLAKERVGIIREAFKGRPFDADQLVFGQLPVFRRFIDAGLWSGKNWGKAVGGLPERKALDVLNTLEEGSEVFSRRVLSGHINPRELDPVTTAERHIRNMLMREHLDPLLPAAKDLTQTLEQSIDDRLGRFMKDYIREIEGYPTGAFEALNSMLRSTVRFLGIDVDERIGERFINTLVRISSSAAIPFRVGLVARNSLQSPFFTAPVIGGKSWYQGVKVALGQGADGSFSFENMKKAVERAVKAGAIDPNVLPIHASNEIFGTQMAVLSKAKVKAQDLFDLGFSIYRTPDDLGRIVAFEGFRHRFFQHWGDFHKGLIDLEEFKSLAKINTFDEVVIAQGESLVRRAKSGAASPDEAANFFGKHLADKTHFLYGNANHPPGWGGISGRLFGQYGTFPVQYLNYVLENGTKNVWSKDWMEFVTTHGALNMGVVLAGAELFDADLQNWATYGSLTYTGGPYAEAAISLVQAMGGSDAERSLALRNLSMMLPTLDSPQSVFVPGSYFIGDLVDAYQEDSAAQMAGEAMGIRFLRPGEKAGIQKGLEWIDEILP